MWFRELYPGLSVFIDITEAEHMGCQLSVRIYPYPLADPVKPRYFIFEKRIGLFLRDVPRHPVKTACQIFPEFLCGTFLEGFRQQARVFWIPIFGVYSKLVAGTETASGMSLRSRISPLEALTVTLAQYCFCDCLTTRMSGFSCIHAVPAARTASTK